MGGVDASGGGGDRRLTVSGSRWIARMLMDRNYLQLYNLEEDEDSDDDKSDDDKSDDNESDDNKSDDNESDDKESEEEESEDEGEGE